GARSALVRSSSRLVGESSTTRQTCSSGVNRTVSEARQRIDLEVPAGRLDTLAAGTTRRTSGARSYGSLVRKVEGRPAARRRASEKQPPSSWLPSDQERLCRSSRLGSHERSGH